jgi:transcriptional regulator with XRE-family HTH domain
VTEPTELGRYLKARRGRVQPADVGLPSGTGVRRTPGLRREELATLAGVSADYYTRLERGRETNPSPAVLYALARVLNLDGPETDHLLALAEYAGGGSRNGPPRRTSCRQVRPTALQLLETVRPNPAYVVGRTNDLLAANPGGLGILPGIADWPEEQRNVTRYVFLHPAARTLWVGWEQLAAGAVAHLRAVPGTDPDDPALTSLVGELTLKSPDFARMWNRYDVRPRTSGTKAYHHPIVGEMRLEFETMPLGGTDGQRVVIYLAEPGTPDYDAMVLLDLAMAETSRP